MALEKQLNKLVTGCVNEYQKIFSYKWGGGVSTVLLIVAGCKGKEEVKPTVSIQQTSPSGDIPLVAGDEINFQIDVRVQGLQNAGQISLIVQSAEGVVIADCAPVTVSNGAAVRLNAAGVVPETTVVRVLHLYI